MTAARQTVAPTSAALHRVCIVGCGRWLRADDQLGLRAAQQLARALPAIAPRVTWTEAPGVDLLNVHPDCDLLIVIDAAATDERLAAGACMRFTFGSVVSAGADRMSVPVLPLRHFGSSHDIGVGHGLALLRQLGACPPTIWLYAIGGVDFGYGEALSSAAAAGCAAAVEQISADLAGWCGAAESADA